MPFYGVQLPSAEGDGGNGVVLEDQKELLSLLKANKAGRFKVFPSREEAERFVRGSPVVVNAVAETPAQDSSEKAAPPSEGCPYPGLTPQQLKEMKMAVQGGDEQKFDDLVSQNPRYLVTTCDTPAVVHSGTRSNPLHVAAASGSARMARRVLEAVMDPALLRRMYPDETQEARNRRLEYLLDMYLNTPSKGNFDTPLHLAAKFGHLDVVKLLAGFSSCDASKVNKAGNTAATEACSRLGGNDVDLKRAIEAVLKGQYYIPVIRDADLNVFPFVGEPWCPNASLTSSSPSDNNNHGLSSPTLAAALTSPGGGSPSFIFGGGYPGSDPSPLASNLNLLSTPRPKSGKSVRQRGEASPLLLAASPSRGGDRSNSSILDNSPATVTGSPVNVSSMGSPLTVQALLGPLSPTEARTVWNEWRSVASRDLRLADPLKGLERAGREVARGRRGAALYEYWPFLDAYCDLASAEGLRLLDNHLHDVGDAAAGVGDADATADSSALSDAAVGDLTLSPVSSLADALAARLRISSPPDSHNSPSDGNVGDGGDDVEGEDDDELYDSLSSLPDSEASFRTACEDPSELQAAAQPPTFILGGRRPSVTDTQVYELLRATPVDRALYPAVHNWLGFMRATSEEERAGWARERRVSAKNASSKVEALRVSKLVIPDE